MKSSQSPIRLSSMLSVFSTQICYIPHHYLCIGLFISSFDKYIWEYTLSDIVLDTGYQQEATLDLAS